MRALPREIGPIHFIGMGGIGMSGIAEVLHNLGYSVQGSDLAESANVRRLRAMGITVHIGHSAENLDEAAIVVTSSAVKPDNPEVLAARDHWIPVVRRAEMLSELMRLRWSVAVGGTHGKTTTTSMIGWVMECGGFDPTVINGGIINAYGTNARLGAGEWMVVEADESDGSFVKLPATVAVVTNMDPEHLENYASFDEVRQAYDAFVGNVPFYGFAALCLDHPEVQALIGRIADRRVVTYGMTPQADVYGTNLRPTGNAYEFDVVIRDRISETTRQVDNVFLPMVGRHNVSNALAAIAVAQEMRIPDAAIVDALKRFEGVKRRFTKTGEVGGITVIDDYGHHPVEISAVLSAARDAYEGRIIAIVQPHRYTRLRDLFDDFCTCFNDADAVIVADVYPAGEAPIPNFDRDALAQGLSTHGHREVEVLDDPADLPAMVASKARSGDVVICLGAGSITTWANDLPQQLEELVGDKAVCAGGRT